MGRPSKYGEPTEAIRIPASKLSDVQKVIDGSFVQNSVDDALVEELVDKILQRCQEEEADPRKLLLYMTFKDLCETLDRFSHREQMEFVARLCDRYLIEEGEADRS